MVESDEEIIRKIHELRQDPKKWERYIRSRVETVVKYWPRTTTPKLKNSKKP